VTYHLDSILLSLTEPCIWRRAIHANEMPMLTKMSSVQLT